MTRAILLLLASLAAQAQLVLIAPDGSTVGASYNLGQVPANTPKDFVFLAKDTGASPISVTSLGIAGSGLTIANSPSVPFVIGPASSQAITIHFGGGAPASYSANFQINTTSVVMVVTSVPAAMVTVLPGCSGPDSSGNIGFGPVQVGQTTTCTFSLQNLNQQSVTVSSVTTSGSGFLLTKPVITPLTLSPGASATFSVTFAPTSAAVDSGSLMIDSQTFSLTGTGLNAPLPTPILEFDSGAPASAQQRIISMRLPSPSPLTASGSVNLSFQPDTNLVPSDPAVVFLASGARSVPFTIQPGDTNINLGGQPGALFQTGTTSGKITFTVTINVALGGDPTVTMVVPPALIFMQSANAIARAGALDVEVFGAFDNTYSAGKMSFVFYDIFGKVIQPEPVLADFTSSFRSYFAAEGGGSDFQMLVTFPVTGQANQIGSVDFAMTNSVGATATQHLTFINDTGQCIIVSATDIVCPAVPSQ